MIVFKNRDVLTRNSTPMCSQGGPDALHCLCYCKALWERKKEMCLLPSHHDKLLTLQWFTYVILLLTICQWVKPKPQRLKPKLHGLAFMTSIPVTFLLNNRKVVRNPLLSSLPFPPPAFPPSRKIYQCMAKAWSPRWSSQSPERV